MLAPCSLKHTALRAVHMAGDGANIGVVPRPNVNRRYRFDFLPAVVALVRLFVYQFGQGQSKYIPYCCEYKMRLIMSVSTFQYVLYSNKSYIQINLIMTNLLLAYWPVCFCLWDLIKKSPSSLVLHCWCSQKSAKLCSKPSHSTWLCWAPAYSYPLPPSTHSENDNLLMSLILK